ncbi:MAG: ABC transporter substrate-binding protein [Firmicutes bacterium]|nr:ABC transporter substrate-binding protein [Bacillota bacterium]
MEKLSSKALFLLVLALIVIVAVFIVFQGNEEEQLTIGIIQIVEHPALDAARDGFVDYLNENGYVVDEDVVYDMQNAQGDMANANTIARKFSNDKPDMILAIATPTAQAVANVVKDIPILITAVTDPVDAGLVESAEKPGGNVTGTNDMNPIDQQFDLIVDFVPEVKRVGIIYNAGESNSLVQVELAKGVAKELGIELVEATADNSAAVLQAAQSLADRVDVIYVPTDNTVVSAVESVVKVAEDNDIPLITGEGTTVKRGALATVGIDYYGLGEQTGAMALKILKGEAEPATMPIESQRDAKLIINKKAAEAMSVTIPDELLDKANEIIE